MTLVLIGTYLQALGHEVSIYDGDKPTPECREYGRNEAGENYHKYEEAIEDNGHPAWLEIRDIIAEYKPEIVGITSVTAKIDSANHVARIAKEISGSIQTALGGSHVLAMSSTYPGYNFGDIYDHIVTTIPNLVDRRPNKKLLMGYKTYSPQNFFTIMTSSGCPFSCTFCCSSYNRKVIYRSIDSIRSEFEELTTEFGSAYSIYFIDESFLSNTPRFLKMASLAREFGMKYQGGGRVMDLSPGKIATFMESGGIKVHIGVESGSQRILDLVRKNVSIVEIKRRTKWLNEAGLPWSAFFIAGFPFETVDDLKMTEELINEIQPSFVSLNHFTPYPGTKIYDDFYKGSNFRFRDMFQLNNKHYLNTDAATRAYIGKMFAFVDKYNQGKKNN